MNSEDRLKSFLVLWFASDEEIILILINSLAMSHSFLSSFSSSSLLNGALSIGFAEADEWYWDRWMILRQVDEIDEISINFIWALRTGGVYFFQKVSYMKWYCSQGTAFAARFSKIDFHSTAWSKYLIWMNKWSGISVSINLIWALRTRGIYFFQKVDYFVHEITLLKENSFCCVTQQNLFPLDSMKQTSDLDGWQGGWWMNRR